MKKKIKDRLIQLGISIVYLFGSEVIGKTHRLSDKDIGVVLKNILEIRDTRGLYTTLFQLFSELYPESKIDIVFLQKAPLSLQFLRLGMGRYYSKKIQWEEPIMNIQ